MRSAPRTGGGARRARPLAAAPVPRRAATAPGLEIPEAGDAIVQVDGHRVRLTNLDKVLWPQARCTKGDLLRYYAAVAPLLLPHLASRPCVLKRFPDGVKGAAFYAQRVPTPTPAWVHTCRVRRGSGKELTTLVIDHPASLLWAGNLGALELHPYYGRCDAPDTPDVLHFDLDPTPGTSFGAVCEAALLVQEALTALELPSLVKTSGATGLHVYVPIERGPSQRDVWRVARDVARVLALRNPKLLTLEYRVARRPRNRVLVDYNQNAIGRTLAAAYSPRPTPRATVSTPLEWREVADGVRAEWFRIDTIPERVARVGDLWAPVAAERGRARIDALVAGADPSGR